MVATDEHQPGLPGIRGGPTTHGGEQGTAMTDRLGPDAAPRGTNLAYIAGLDGIRGVGMLNIMGVHAGVWLTGGGFYLLDSFFALSGFLITTLLITEWRKRRRHPAEHLLGPSGPAPAPSPVPDALGVAFIFGVLVPAGTYPGLRGDALSSLFYFANWHFILSSSNYFDQTNLTSPSDPHVVAVRGGAVLSPLALAGCRRVGHLAIITVLLGMSSAPSPRRPRWRCSSSRATPHAFTSAPTPMRSRSWSVPPSPWPGPVVATALAARVGPGNRFGRRHGVDWEAPSLGRGG